MLVTAEIDNTATGRLSLIGDDTDDARLVDVFQRAQSGFGHVPNLYRTLGHSPELLEAWLSFAWPLRNAADTPRSTRELVILRMAQLDNSTYEWAQHRPMAIAAGVDEAQIASLEAWQTNRHMYSESELAALAIADAVNAGGDVPDADWDRLRGLFDEKECLEIVLTASFYACVSRVLKSLRVPLEE